MPIAAPQNPAVPSEQMQAEKRRQYMAQPTRLQPEAAHWAPIPTELREVTMQRLFFRLNPQLDYLAHRSTSQKAYTPGK